MLLTASVDIPGGTCPTDMPDTAAATPSLFFYALYSSCGPRQQRGAPLVLTFHKEGCTMFFSYTNFSAGSTRSQKQSIIDRWQDDGIWLVRQEKHPGPPAQAPDAGARHPSPSVHAALTFVPTWQQKQQKQTSR
ncbi:unnamed protein product [Symbiodinium natans]|uniref:Uncharacterized protein n=1 Tax=Symbiodinium natans TaxID=878477 RepID=A0A812SAF0_9DINO|nr:unnamed protein product [Symbiodinium natans]